mgnify:CR=1 FL=1
MSKTYTVSDVSRLMGASETTILIWIQQGRFLGISVNNPVFKPDTVYVSVTGVRLTLAEIEELYRQEQKRLGRYKPMTPEEEIQEFKNEIRYFEEKYGGPFEETLGAKEELSPQERRDAEQWTSLLRSLQRRITQMDSAQM